MKTVRCLLYSGLIAVPIGVWLQPPWWATYSVGLLVCIVVQTWQKLMEND